MARGRLLRTKIRETKALARAKLEGERQFYRTQKGTVHWIKKEAIDIFKKQPIKIIVFCGTTYLCYKTLEKVEDVVQATIGIGAHVFMEFTWLGMYLFPKYTGQYEELEKEAKKIGFGNVQLLLLSMLMAYLIMEHGFEIMGGIVSGAKLLLGI